MGTHGLLLFVYKKRRVGVYNHFDSYPSGLGIEFIRFIIEHLKNESLELFLEKLFSVTFIEKSDRRDAMSVIKEVYSGYMKEIVNMESFETDFDCNWVYTVNWDTKEFSTVSPDSNEGVEITIKSLGELLVDYI